MKNILFSVLIILVLSGEATPLFAQPDSIRICALRVDFTRDNNVLTTGNGGFMIDTTTTDPFAIDPAPHNKIYFEDQIKAAAGYFNNVSAGRVQVTGRVFPAGNNDAYTLPHEMGYYNPNTTPDEINAGLSHLFVDAVNEADQSGDINFSEFDLLVIFHAGVGKDVDIGYDTTPQDISSLFITKKFLQTSLGESFGGIAVNSGAKIIEQGIILPETENQEGYAIALTGMFVSNIGSYLGLYDLFSPSRQRSGIGRFGLMDAGLLNANGLLPSPPEAFSRELLGWETPALYEQPERNILIGRFGSEIKLPLSIRIPISNDEYYLLEYRGDSHVNIDSLFVVLAEGRSTAPTYLEVLKTYFPDKIEIGASGVLTSVADYDWGLPGAGILIWHIDERIIAQKGGENKINDDPAMRGVDLEEADGAQDIGQIYTLLEPGYQTELGTLADFWYSNRPDFLENFEQYKNEFSDSSAPNTRANLNNALSHITLRNFTANKGDAMSFDFERNMYEPGFPKQIISEGSTTVAERKWKTVAGRIEGQEAGFLILFDQIGGIYGVGSQGVSLSDTVSNLIGKISLARSGQSLALSDLDMNGSYDRLFIAQDSSLYDVNFSPGITPEIKPVRHFPAAITAPLICNNLFIKISCANDSIYTLNVDGGLVTQEHVSVKVNDLVMGQIDPIKFNNEIDFVAVFPVGQLSEHEAFIYSGQAQKFYKYSPLTEQSTEAFDAPGDLTGQFAVADIDFNGIYEIVYATAKGIFAVNQEGSPISRFPIFPELGAEENIIGTPLILDADADGQIDFIVATNRGQVMAFNSNAAMISGFPLATGEAVAETPVVLQLDSDAEMELMGVTTTGTVYAWQLKCKEDDPLLLWTQENYNASNNAVITEVLTYKPVGTELMPANRVYNYPNPNQNNYTTIRYYLNEDASIKIRVFDTAGLQVDEFSGPGIGGADNEIRWDVSGIASGVYLCRIEAESTQNSSSTIIKIMVIH